MSEDRLLVCVVALRNSLQIGKLAHLAFGFDAHLFHQLAIFTAAVAFDAVGRGVGATARGGVLLNEDLAAHGVATVAVLLDIDLRLNRHALGPPSFSVEQGRALAAIFGEGVAVWPLGNEVEACVGKDFFDRTVDCFT